jgi:hypothetical protein
VTLTASDGEASASCVGHVTVVDTTKPAVSCPASRVLATCSPSGTTASFELSASDNCGAPAVTCSYASGSTFPMGETSVTCSAKDGSGNTASCGFKVTVRRDTSPPTPGADLGYELWSPNHKYESLPVTLSQCAAPATDACGGSLPLNQYGRILRITSDEVEDDNGNGDGRTCDDMVIVSPASMRLRSEREGTGDGRVYTVTYVVTAPTGASTQGTCHVYVPHDQSGRGAVDSGAKFCVGEGCPPGTAEHSALCR